MDHGEVTAMVTYAVCMFSYISDLWGGGFISKQMNGLIWSRIVD